ncbi:MULTISPECIES: EF-hand domain-containing protein [unclassified Streptomyces]|uniref:EF-hand domain-containing protein n=1 Tax=unclassified Streptomyces TaxID=2593676 RepID=UPI0016614D6B|nr:MULTISPECIES: EF-hand domain-containing protein [unclassified Streptomyces]MBD0709760.1 calcium-binding protein [Streptomyces sp. CBMA291]MBD0714252.1 calcium-binding protein [Streptomyces sp. CBMA370]
MPVRVKSQKFSMLFDWFDQGGDGVLTHDDFQAMGDLFTALAAEDDQENASAMREAFEEWWRVLLTHGDADGDGRITRKEFLDVMEANVTDPRNFEKAVLAIADALMRALDTNGDGVLSKDEYVRMYSALGIPPEHSGEAFRRLDRDGDGAISHEEFRTAIREFYLSTDDKAPGNWLIGPLDKTA